jgi:hydroxymethylglutaryl-CoA reductase (NADPH)
LYKKCLENYIGSVEIPIGVAGPVLINGDYSKGEFYIPMATTEGTLVASTNRGASITRKSGGIQITSDFIGITRAPLFRTSGIVASKKTVDWVSANFALLASVAEDSQDHLKLLKIEHYSHGKNLWLKMFFDTDEAMGMNMATKASNSISKTIIKNVSGVGLLSVSGNMCSDKKPSALNMITGRGRRVRAEAFIKEEYLTKYFRTTAKQIASVNKNKIWEGTGLSGGDSYNAHFANTIAACFASTGQDLGHVIDSSMGYCTMEEDNGDLYVSITLPCMIVGTHGGGTMLPKQKKSQELMLTEVDSKKLITKNPSDALAEIITAAVLCSELSLHAALATNEHIKAHEEYGRSTNGKC